MDGAIHHRLNPAAGRAEIAKAVGASAVELYAGTIAQAAIRSDEVVEIFACSIAHHPEPHVLGVAYPGGVRLWPRKGIRP